MVRTTFLSPAVRTREFDLSNIVPSVSTTEAAYTGQFSWGPVEERTLIESGNELVNTFWKPNNNNFEDFFTASNFLDYGNQLWLVRMVDDTNANATLQSRNATCSNTTGFLVKNESHYSLNFNDGSLDVTHGCGPFISKYPGTLGNSLKISICPSAGAYESTLQGSLAVNVNSSTVTGTNTLFSTQLVVGDFLVLNNETVKVASITNATSLTLTTSHISGAVANTSVLRRWEYFIEVDNAPTVSEYASSLGGATDEIHVVVVDEDGAFTGTRGTVLEVWQKMSKASDAKLDDGTNNYYAANINNNSRYLWWAGHGTGLTNAGTAAAGTTFGAPALPIAFSLQGGRDGANIGNSHRIRGYNMFKNPEEIDISLVIGGAGNQTTSVHLINNIAEYREDCVAVLSVPRNTVLNNAGKEAIDVVNYRNTLPSTSWAFLDSGWKYQYDKYNDVYRWVPCSGDTAGLMVQTDLDRDPWWSPAGYNRGNIKNVIKIAFNPSKTDRDHMYKNGVNPIVTFPNDGTVLFGDKTLQAKPSALDRINVRRLLIVLRKAIAKAAKYMLFEFNDAFTQQSFKNMVEPYLRDVKGRRGLQDYRVICDSSNNTGEVIDRNEFTGDLYLKPSRVINYISLNFIVVRSSVEFTEVIGKFGG